MHGTCPIVYVLMHRVYPCVYVLTHRTYPCVYVLICMLTHLEIYSELLCLISAECVCYHLHGEARKRICSHIYRHTVVDLDLDWIVRGKRGRFVIDDGDGSRQELEITGKAE